MVVNELIMVVNDIFGYSNLIIELIIYEEVKEQMNMLKLCTSWNIKRKQTIASTVLESFNDKLGKYSFRQNFKITNNIASSKVYKLMTESSSVDLKQNI